MHIKLIAVGDRQPAWVNDAFSSYTARLPREWRFDAVTLPAAKRSKNDKSDKAKLTEGERILSKVSAAERVVTLDEHGRQFTSPALAQSLRDWQQDGRDIVFVIGGPDGLSKACLQRADLVWSLSDLTLPHGLARVLLLEQLYRAWSLQTGHPYHRE